MVVVNVRSLALSLRHFPRQITLLCNPIEISVYFMLSLQYNFASSLFLVEGYYAWTRCSIELDSSKNLFNYSIRFKPSYDSS